MIYLVLDTNIWIYLANGFDTVSNSFHGNHHFELLRSLMDHSDDGDVCVLVNDVIIAEYQRNKGAAEKKIAILQNKLNDPSKDFKEITPFIKSHQLLQEEYLKEITEQIEANKKHLELLENFLNNNCQKVTISDKVKIQVFDLAINKKAPFLKNKNNVADAAILLSIPEFFENHWWRYGDSIMFVSNNFKEYGEGKDSNEFHPDLVKLLIPQIQYHKKLPSALKLSSEMIKEIDAYNEHRVTMNEPFDCQNLYCEYTSVYFEGDSDVKYESDDAVDPNQTNLFNFTPSPSKKSYTYSGHCPMCCSLHFQCPECKELVFCEEPGYCNCDSCETEFEVFAKTENTPIYILVRDIFS